MRKAQLSLDLLFAVVLISITVLSLLSLSFQEAQGARTLDTMAKLKVFTVDLRDTVTKVYSVGPGYSVRKELPLNLKPGDAVWVTLNATSNTVEVEALVSGNRYFTSQKLPVRLVSTTSLELTPGSTTFWVVATYNETVGMVDVKLSR